MRQSIVNSGPIGGTVPVSMGAMDEDIFHILTIFYQVELTPAEPVQAHLQPPHVRLVLTTFE